MKCYFCETAENVNSFQYVFIKDVAGKLAPVQVAVCNCCKDEYEATFPKY